MRNKLMLEDVESKGVRLDSRTGWLEDFLMSDCQDWLRIVVGEMLSGDSNL